MNKAFSYSAQILATDAKRKLLSRLEKMALACADLNDGGIVNAQKLTSTISVLTKTIRDDEAFNLKLKLAAQSHVRGPDAERELTTAQRDKLIDEIIAKALPGTADDLE